jgi:ubiquinone/menaquinone biosynthesis C-methylase UbiE
VSVAFERTADLAAVRLDPKRANALYHDAAARTYDAKWAISFDERCIRYVRARAERMLPKRHYGRVLEIGTGTGFFILNMWLAGLVGEPHACDISSGMLEVCAESARRIGCDLGLRLADAESLPYEDGTFDLVLAHAVLHHLPRPENALQELHRVVKPGGALFVAGEPTRLGDRLARASGRLTGRAYRAAARVASPLRKPDRPEAASEDERILRELEWDVDLHTFRPAELAQMARRSGFGGVHVETEELVSSLVGWAVRTIESEAPDGLLGARWGAFAYRTYLGLYALDAHVLARLLPRDLFYNALLYGEKADGG